MDYREIVAVTGIGGLFQLVASKGDGAVVRALADGKTQFVSARKHHVTPLESIEIYTMGENVRLHEVLQRMKDAEGSTPLPDTGSPEAIRGYFETVLPEYDRDRVYASDLKKMVRWYSLLKSADLLDFSRYQQQEAEGREGGDDALANGGMPLEGQVQVAESTKTPDGPMEPAQSPEAAVDAPAKKSRAKKAAEPAGEEDGAAPTKKTAKKKAATPDSDDPAAPKKTARKKKDEGEA